jgi:hypothetical protein
LIRVNALESVHEDHWLVAYIFCNYSVHPRKTGVNTRRRGREGLGDDIEKSIQYREGGNPDMACREIA